MVFFTCLFAKTGLETIDATRQAWAGGRKEAGRGVFYNFNFVAKCSSSKLNVNELWVDGNYFEVRARKHDNGKFVYSFQKNDTINVHVNYMENRYVKQDNQPKCPVDGKHAAVLGYTLKGDKKYVVIESFKELDKMMKR